MLPDKREEGLHAFGLNRPARIVQERLEGVQNGQPNGLHDFLVVLGLALCEFRSFVFGLDLLVDEGNDLRDQSTCWMFWIDCRMMSSFLILRNLRSA